MKVLVIGAREGESRYANLAIKSLLFHKHEVVATGTREGNVEGIKVQTGQPMFEDIDTVTLYVGTRNQAPLYDYLVKLKPKRVIFNPGTENPELYKILRDNNIEYEVACTLVMLGTGQF